MATNELGLADQSPAATERPGGAAARPYAPSWIDLTIRWIDRAPGPTWLVYAILLIPSVIFANAANWLSGLVPAGTLTPQQTFWGVWTVGFVWVMHHLNGVAGSAFDTFRPAIASADLDLDRARYEMTVIPARPALVLAGIAVPFTLLYYVSDPVASSIVGLTGAGLIVRAVSEIFSTAIILVLIYHAFRQLRSVSRLHAAADRIDPFRPAPLHAFSRLTAQTGAVIIGVVTLGYVGNPVSTDSASFVTLWLPFLIVFPAVALAIFVVPLMGMHGRLIVEKERLRDGAEDRLKSVLTELNRDVDSLELGRADGLGKLLASLLQEREILAKLPTWPWSTGTLRGFISALLLPMALFLVQRFVGALLPG